MIWNFSSSGVPEAPFPVFRLDSFWACETQDGLLAVAGKLPWGQLPPFFTDLPYAGVSYTAFCGWDGDLWYDGPQYHIVDHQVQRCVLPGSRLPLPGMDKADPEAFAQWLEKHEMMAWKKSLAWAFRERLALSETAYVLQGLHSHPLHVLVLLGLRIAFPHINFYALHYPEDRKPQWKRYCQNLNLSTWAAPAQLQGLPALDISVLSHDWPEPTAQAFLTKLNKRIPVVPGKLARIFSDS